MGSVKPPQWRHPAVGLPHVHAAGEVRRARRPRPRHLLPLAAAPLRVRRRRLQNQGVELQAEALYLHPAGPPGLHPDDRVPPRVPVDPEHL